MKDLQGDISDNAGSDSDVQDGDYVLEDAVEESELESEQEVNNGREHTPLAGNQSQYHPVLPNKVPFTVQLENLPASQFNPSHPLEEYGASLQNRFQGMNILSSSRTQSTRDRLQICAGPKANQPLPGPSRAPITKISVQHPTGRVVSYTHGTGSQRVIQPVRQFPGRLPQPLIPNTARLGFQQDDGSRPDGPGAPRIPGQMNSRQRMLHRANQVAFAQALGEAEILEEDISEGGDLPVYSTQRARLEAAGQGLQQVYDRIATGHAFDDTMHTSVPFFLHQGQGSQGGGFMTLPQAHVNPATSIHQPSLTERFLQSRAGYAPAPRITLQQLQEERDAALQANPGNDTVSQPQQQAVMQLQQEAQNEQLTLNQGFHHPAAQGQGMEIQSLQVQGQQPPQGTILYGSQP
ncbi:hypothetical protein BGZ63DRAFT_385660 [Mariannaea sp. PMI_226]|nr:hypothetical protein BGZ63DRAFT_385660 [Mariannaea sp. PMI_226]